MDIAIVFGASIVDMSRILVATGNHRILQPRPIDRIKPLPVHLPGSSAGRPTLCFVYA